MNTPQEGATLSLSDVAEMTGKSLPVVSNWRRRNDDFPEPVAEGRRGSGLFAARDITNWLDERGIPYDRQEVSLSAVAWNAANGFRGELSVQEIETLLLEAGTLVALDRGASGASVEERVTRVLNKTERPMPPDAFSALVEASRGRLRAPVDEVIGYFERHEPSLVASAFDDIIERGATSKGTGEFWTPKSLAALMSSLAPAEAQVFYDPACGTGALLSHALRHSEHPHPKGLGQDLNAAALHIAQLRFALFHQDVEVRQGDTLDDDRYADRLTDVVLCDAPLSVKYRGTSNSMDTRWQFSPALPSTADLMWIQHAVAHLAPAGIGLVTTSMGALSRGGREQQIRAELIRRGAVEAVIMLPARMLPATSVPLALWVLRRPDHHAASDSVLFVDASALGTRPGRKRVELPDEAITRIASLVRAWQQSGVVERADAEIAASVARLDILGSDANLVPTRWIETLQSPNDVARHQQQVTAALDRALASYKDLTTAPPLPRLALSGMTERSAVSIERLVSEGSLELVKTVRVEEGLDDASGLPVVSPRDVIRPDSTNIKRYTTLSNSAATTKPGDVLIAPSAAEGIATMVETSARVPARGLIVLRIVGDWISPAALSQIIAWDTSASVVSTIPHLKVKDLSIPLLSEDERAQLTAFFDSVEHHARIVRTYQTALEEFSKHVRIAAPQTAQFQLGSPH